MYVRSTPCNIVCGCDAFVLVWVPLQIGPAQRASWRAPRTGGRCGTRAFLFAFTRLAQGHGTSIHHPLESASSSRADLRACLFHGNWIWCPLSARGLSHGFSTSHEWSTECGWLVGVHNSKPPNVRVIHNSEMESLRDSKQDTINVRGIFAMRWSNHSEILVSSESEHFPSVIKTTQFNKKKF